MKRIKGKNAFWLKALIWLAGIMILFTVISKITDSFTVAKVKTADPSQRKLQYEVSAEGQIEKNREVFILTQPELLVKSVLVSEGQRVKKGDLLARLDMKQLNERIDTVTGEKRALELQNEAVQKNRHSAWRKRAKALAQAKKAYAQLREKNRKALAKAKKKQDKKAWRELQKAAEQEEKEAKKAIEEAGEEPESDNSVEVNNISIRNLQRQVDKLEKIRKQKGEIRSTAAGVITGILVNVGQKTADTGFFTMTDENAGLKFIGKLMLSDTKYVSVGDKVTLQSAGRKLEDIAVTSMEMDENREFMNVTALLPADTFALGETVTMTVKQESQSYPCTVPVTALRQESGKSFVLAVQKEDTVLGEQEVARQMEVTVVEKNESYVALEADAMDKETRIITDSDRFVENGDRIRPEEEKEDNVES